MFEPGHLRRVSLPGQIDFSVDLFYEVRNDPQKGAMLAFRMEGQVAGRAFCEDFELHRDTAFNFASVASKVAERHGLPRSHTLLMRGHNEFDRMFNDIREKLGAQPGEPVNFDHLQEDGM